MKLVGTGFTTGTCGAAAAKAAALQLCGQNVPAEIEVGLPDGERVKLPLRYVHATPTGAEAAVCKDAGDDPDISHGASIIAAVEWNTGSEVVLRAGEGVGTVTKPGLSVPPGLPAINPVPRKMILAAVREVTPRGLTITLSIPGGRELAEKTFNPRLGVVGGLSILGTSGRVRPFSVPALRDALKCALNVAAACGVSAPVFVPGHIGARAAAARFKVSAEQIVEVSNEWGFMLEEAVRYPFTHLLIFGHPGKLAKLAAGIWDTHSARSSSAVPIVAELGAQVFERALPVVPTVEGLFAALPADERGRLGAALAERVRAAVAAFLGARGAELRVPTVAAGLVDMRGELLGVAGEMTAWAK